MKRWRWGMGVLLAGGAAGVTFMAVERVEMPPYSRSEWKHWTDADENCLSTRHEALAEESLIEPTFEECRVTSGLWEDPYDPGQRYSDPSVLDLDHLVPLAESHRSGGWAWNADKKEAYANDLEDPWHLVATHRRLNRQKGAKDPAGWKPPDEGVWCDYAAAWRGVKTRWGLSIDPREERALAEMEATCPEEGG